MLFGIVSCTLVLFLTLVQAVGSTPEIVKSIEFGEAFRDYFEALGTHTVDDLEFELSETIEDVLTTGSHLTRASLDYKVRMIEKGILSQLRQQLCPPSSDAPLLAELKLTTVHCTYEAGRGAKVSFTNEEFGMLTGVVVRLLQSRSMEEFCRGN